MAISEEKQIRELKRQLNNFTEINNELRNKLEVKDGSINMY